MTTSVKTDEVQTTETLTLELDIDSKLKDQLPACFHPLSQSNTYISGYVLSESELQSVLECYSKLTLTSFVKWSDDKARVKKSANKRRLLWKFEDYSNNVPLTIQNRQILCCQFGKAKPPKTKKEQTKDHHDYRRKRRFHIQKSRKVNCPAKVYIRHVVRYDDFKVKEGTSKAQRQIVLDNLCALMTKGEPISTQCMIHIKLPFIDAHSNHKVSLESGFARRIHPERWCRAYAPNDFSVAVNTNNGVEAPNNSLKRFYLSLSGTGTLSSLVETLVSDFIPEQLLTYIQLNYSFSGQYKAYNPDIPHYLHNRPRSFVKTCLKRLTAAADFSEKDVIETGHQMFKVRSEVSAEWYDIDLGDDQRYPSCTCVSFRTMFLPCKHMFAVFNNTQYTWDSLSSKYRGSPYLNLDENFLSSESLESCQAAIHEGNDAQHLEEGNQCLETPSPGLMVADSHVILKIQASVREKLKSICDSSYLCMDINCLHTVITELDRLDQILRKGIPLDDNLPIHQCQDAVPKQSLRQLPRRSKKSILSKKRKRKQNVQTADITISPDNDGACDETSTATAGMMKDQVIIGEEKQTHKKRVRFACDDTTFKTNEVCSSGIMKTNAKNVTSTLTEDIMEKYAILSSELEEYKGIDIPRQTKKRYYICGEVLEDTDFATLTHPKWLNDKVINAYLACLKMSTNTACSNHIFALPSYTAVLWDLGRMDCWLFKKAKFLKFSWIFLPINVNKCHWTLLAADVPQRKVSILDSMHGEGGKKYLGLWRTFMELRDKKTDEKLGSWDTGSVISAKQHDGNTCGAFVMLNALALTRGIPPDVVSHSDAVCMCKFALGKLLEAAVKPPSQRSVCDMVGCTKSEQKQKWIACDVCGRWCHFKCVNITRNPKGSYVCPICRAQYD